MSETLKIEITRQEMIDAVKGMKKKEREAFVEDLLAATSPKYLRSIKEARSDYKARKTLSHAEIFGD